MAETLSNYLSKKLNENESEETTVSTDAPNQEAAAEIYGSAAHRDENGHRSLDNPLTADISKVQTLKEFSEELIRQKGSINQPGSNEFMSSETRTESISAVDSREDKVLFENNLDENLNFAELGEGQTLSALARVRGNNVLGSSVALGEKPHASGWVRSAGISPIGIGNKQASLGPGSSPNYESPNAELHPVEHAVHEALKATNRFSPSSESPYIREGEYSRGLYSFQDGLENTEGTETRGSRYNANAREISLSDMKKIADDILLAAVGHTGMSNIGDIGKDKWGSFATDLAFNASDVQLGLTRVSKLHLLHAGTSKAAGELGIRSRQNDDFLLNDGSFQHKGSYGTLNSPAEPFSQPLALGMLWPTIYMMLLLLAVSILIEILFLIPGISSLNDPKSNLQINKPWNRTKGSSGPRRNWAEKMIIQIMGLSNLDYSFIKDLSEGIKVFFDLPTTLDELTDPTKLAEAVFGLAQAPGYYAVVLKQVTRDFEQIEEAFDDMGGAGMMAGINQLFGVLEAVFSSTTFRFFVRMVELGDIVQKSREPGRHAHDDFVPEKTMKTFSLIGANRQSHLSRYYPLNGSSPKSPLSLHMFPAAILAGQSIEDFSAGKTRGLTKEAYIPENVFSLDEDDKKVSLFYNDSSTSVLRRLPQQTVKLYEQILDLEYMPFYFQDLRTNEIIGLPAFISSLTDSFSVEYNETKAYGRTDAVKIYNGTSRTIDMTFKLVSMNKIDHEYMWMVINKLTSMLYPQRGFGRIRKNGDQQFIQPFSQPITSSPLIRIRLGEVLHSNYSVSAFSTMMGHPGTLTARVSADGKTESEKQLAALKRGGLKTKLKVAKNIFAQDYMAKLLAGLEVGKSVKVEKVYLKPGTDVEIFEVKEPSGGLSFSALAGFFDFPDVQLPINVSLSKELFGSMQVTKIIEGDDESLVIRFYSSEFDKISETINRVKLGVSVSNFSRKVKKGNRMEAKFNYKDGDILISSTMADLERALPSGNLRDAVKLARKSSTPEGYISAERDMITQNPFFRAFQTTMGTGMAGVITQFSLNYDGATWNTEPTSRAPNSVEVSLTFSPIHDLTPGLDITGRVIAPTHPVGRTSNQDVRDNVSSFDTLSSTRASAAKSATAKPPEGGAPNDPTAADN
jgi:hypothetical protein